MTDLEAAVSLYLAHRHRRRLAPGTLTGDRYELRRFLSFCRRHAISRTLDVTAELIDRFAVHVRLHYRTRGPGRPRRLAPATVIGTLQKVSSFFRFLVREGHLLEDPTCHLTIRGRTTLKTDRAVSLPDLDAMVRGCDPDTKLGLRNHAILEVLFGCGLRRAELVALDLYDVDLPAGTVFVRHGKGDKPRLIPLAGQARRALRTYLDRCRPTLISARTGDALFLGEWGRRLTGSRIQQIVHEAATRAGVSAPVTPHGFRHGYALALLRNGAGVHAVQRLLGHARVDTTEHYTALTVEDLQAIHRRTHPRERRR